MTVLPSGSCREHDDPVTSCRPPSRDYPKSVARAWIPIASAGKEVGVRRQILVNPAGRPESGRVGQKIGRDTNSWLPTAEWSGLDMRAQSRRRYTGSWDLEEKEGFRNHPPPPLFFAAAVPVRYDGRSFLYLIWLLVCLVHDC